MIVTKELTSTRKHVKRLKISYLHGCIPEELLNIVKKVSNERRDKVKTETRERLKKKLNGLFEKTSPKQKAPESWVKNISHRVLDANEVNVLSYGMKHSLTPKHLPTAKILASVEAAIGRKQDPPIETKEISSR